MLKFDTKNCRVIKKLTLVQTSGVWPEQYDVYKGKKQVGYIRLRHGYSTCEVPDVFGKMVLDIEPNENIKGDNRFGYGCFVDEEERVKYLTMAIDAILNHKF